MSVVFNTCQKIKMGLFHEMTATDLHQSYVTQ